MKKILLNAAALLIIGGSLAAARTISVWGHEFEASDTQPMMADVGTLTDPTTKHHMNYIKLKNGHMMAVVPLEQYMSFYKMTGPDDMMQ